MNRTSFCLAHAALAAAMACTLPSRAAELFVKVSGIVDGTGQIGCALFKSAQGFPMDNSGARQIWLLADPKGVVCRYGDLPDGGYAVSVSHDLNGNRKLDTNFLGIPTEAWGVSNNVRPRLRAPRWDEAVFSVADGKDLTLEIKVAP